MKDEEISKLKSAFEQSQQEHIDYIKELESELAEEKRSNEELMEIVGNRLNNDSIIDNSREQIMEYENELKHKDQEINNVQQRNQELTHKLDQICNEKSVLEEKFESFENMRQSFDQENNNQRLNEKIEYLQHELENLTNTKNNKEQEK